MSKQLVKGPGLGTSEWREDFVLTATDSLTPLFKVSQADGSVALTPLTTTQKNAIPSPAAGTLVYDSTLNKLSVFTGSVWETVTSS